MNIIQGLIGIPLVLLFSISTEAQYCTSDNRFTEEQYFTNRDITVVTDVVYGNAVDFEGNSQDLLMDIRFPSGENEPLSKRPFILMIHGGGFTDNSKRTKALASRYLTQRGFVTAAINYRLGYDDTKADDGFLPAVYRAQQDAFAALRYIVENADTYGIDTNWIFVEGRSAGATTALNCVFADEADWEAYVPGVADRWGPLNSSGNALKNNFTTKAVTAACGATGTMAIDRSDMVPMVLFHGEFDHLAPIDTSDEGEAGSRFIYNQLVDHGVCSELTVDPDGGHCPHSRNYRVDRSACFFKRIFCDACESNAFTEEVPTTCSSTIVATREIEAKEPAIQIQPNPVRDQFTLSGAVGTQVEIFSATGQPQRTIYPNENQLILDISAWPAGIYFLQAKRADGNSFEIRKIVKY